jgi:hypothetical protein
MYVRQEACGGAHGGEYKDPWPAGWDGAVPKAAELRRSVLVVYGCGADTFKVKLEPRGGRPWEKFAVNLVVVQRLLQLR